MHGMVNMGDATGKVTYLIGLFGDVLAPTCDIENKQCH